MLKRMLPIVFLLIAAAAFGATELEPKVLAPTSATISDVACAFGGGKYLTVWRQYSISGATVWGAFSDGDGKPLGPAFLVLGNANALDLHLFNDGESFLFVWNEANQSTRFCHVDFDGHANAPQRLD